MASWGLLQGFGRGLSQSSELLSRGVAEDREVERQRLREASAEARWKRQEDREDARNKVTDARLDRQEDRQKRLDTLTAEESAAQKKYREDTIALQRDELNVKISERRRAEIEGKLGGLQREYEKGAESLDRRYERLIDSAKQTDQQNGFAKDKDGFTETDKAYMARDKALASLSSEFTAKMVPVVRSYGDELKGTAFSSYLDDVKAEDERQKDHAGKQFLRDAGVIDAEGKFTDQQQQVKSSGRGDLVNQIVGSGGSAAATPSAAQATQQAELSLPQPGYFSGLNNGFSGFVNPAPSADNSDSSILDDAMYGIGTFHGSLAGLPGDALQMAYQGGKGLLKPAYLTLTTKPSEMAAAKAAYAQQRLGGGNLPAPIPGETPQQYAARTGVKR